MKKLPLLLACLSCLGLVEIARGDVKPHSLFTDNMVIQQGMKAPVWGKADPGEKVEVSFSMTHTDGKGYGVKPLEATSDQDGNWRIDLPALPVGEKGTLTIKGKNTIELKNVLVGEVWIASGQSNMEWSVNSSFEPKKTIEAANYPNIRLYTVQKRPLSSPQYDCIGKWVECSPQTVVGFSAVAYYFGRDIHLARKVPVGLIHTSWGGTPAQAWTSREALLADPMLKYYQEQLDAQKKAFDSEKAKKDYEAALAKYKLDVEIAKKENKPAPKAPQMAQGPGNTPNSPSALFNGMIAPLVPFAIKGAIWYQGESNASKAYEYRTLFTAMIQDWRNQWKQGDFPFLCVQLAPFMKIVPNPTESNWAELREAQWMSTKKLKNVAMAVITDVGEENDIHPRKKEPVGARLALAARALAYGEKIEFSGPEYKAMKVDGNKAVLTFDHVGEGLKCEGKSLTGFTICGEDRKWVNAEAVIEGNTVIVASPDVTKPVAVRFGWANYPVVNLWNKDGLPATPFRTDDFPITTQPKSKQ